MGVVVGQRVSEPGTSTNEDVAVPSVAATRADQTPCLSCALVRSADFDCPWETSSRNHSTTSDTGSPSASTELPLLFPLATASPRGKGGSKDTRGGGWGATLPAVTGALES